jgi:hypothetical protein
MRAPPSFIPAPVKIFKKIKGAPVALNNALDRRREAGLAVQNFSSSCLMFSI